MSRQIGVLVIYMKPVFLSLGVFCSLLFSVCAAALTVTASSDDGHGPENTIDGDLSAESRWSARGDGEWIEYDLGAAEVLDDVQIAFHKGDQRVAYFDIQVALSRGSWSTLLPGGASSGTTTALQRFELADQSVRYVRIVGRGNSINDWNSLTEVVLNLAGGSPPPAGGGLDPNLPPSGNFDLNHWKLTLPVSKNFYFGSGGSSAAEILPDGDGASAIPINDGYADPAYFHTGSDGAMIFRTPLSGGATTTNTSYVRSELRELYNWQSGQSTSTANWHNEGRHILEGTCRVDKYYAADPQTVVGQIHAKNSNKALVKLQWDGPAKKVRAIINRDPVSGNPFSLKFEEVGTARFSYRIMLEDNRITLTVGNTTHSVTFGQGGMSASWDDYQYYFKAGNYAQADKDSGGLFEVHFYSLSVSHSP